MNGWKIHIWPPANRTGTTGNGQFWGWRGFVGFQQRLPHIFGDGSRDQEAIRIARRSGELYAITGKVEHRSIEHARIGFASVAASCGHLAELERTPKQTPVFFRDLFGQFG